MQMGDHQMLGNQRGSRPFIQKGLPGGGAPGAGGGAQTGSFVQAQTVRVMARDGGQPQQRMFQVVQVSQTRQVLASGAGPHLVRQVHAQQFHTYGHVQGTIAGRAAGNGGVQIRAVQQQQQGGQHHFQRQGGQQQQMSLPRGAVFVSTSANSSSSQQTASQRYAGNQPSGAQNGGAQNPPVNIVVNSAQYQQQQQMAQMRARAQQNAHHMLQNRQNPQQQQQAMYVPRGMNLAVPLREPSPEPVPVKQEIVEPPPPVVVKNEEPIPDDEDIDIQIRNVVCNYTLPLHIDLRKLAMNTTNVTYEREKGVMMKQKRSPGCYIKIYSSGKIYIVGCRSEADCKKAARSIARHIQRVMGKLDERVTIRNYRVNNVLATCRLPFGIKIEDVNAKYPHETQYEPELNTGLIWRSTEPKATLRIHTTGSICVTGAPSEAAVLEILSKIYPIVAEFRCAERAKQAVVARKRKRKAPAASALATRPIKRERQDDGVYGESGVYNNQVYFSDEEEDLYADIDLDD